MMAMRTTKLSAAVLLVRWYLVPLAAAVVALHVADPAGVASTAQAQVEFRLQSLAGPRPTASVALVQLTGSCRAHLPRWPPTPAEHARVVEVLGRAGARAVALMLPPGGNEGAARSVPPAPGAHPGSELSAALRAARPRVVVGCRLVLDRELAAATGDIVTRVRWAVPDAVDRAIDRSRLGFLELDPFDLNADAAVHRAPVALEQAGRRDEAFARCAARAAAPDLVLPAGRVMAAADASLTLGGAPAGLSGGGRLLSGRPLWAGPGRAGAFPVIAYSTVHRGDPLPAADLAGRLVVVSALDPGAPEARWTPFGWVAIAEVHANIAAALLDGRLAARAGPASVAAAVAAFAAALGLAFHLLPVAFAMFAVAGLIAAAAAACYALLVLAGLSVSPIPFALLAVLGALFQPARLALTGWAIAAGAGCLETDARLFRAAEAALARGDTARALSLFRAVHERLGGVSPRSDLAIVRVLLRSGELEAARRALRALDLKAYDLPPLVELGREFDQVDMLIAATDLFEHVYLRDNDHPEIVRLLRDSRARLETQEKSEGFASLNDVVRGKLQDLQFVGRGGMSLVWRAWDPAARAVVALKTLTPTYAKDPRVVTRFEREVLAMKSLDHPGIARVFDLSLGAYPYFTMEYLVGDDLRTVLDRHGRLPVARTVAIGRQVCEALVHAHARGIIHRDIKPENIVLLDQDRVKLLDFGVAKVERLVSITRTGAAIGSPWYMAPEQDLGGAVDGRADVFSLAVVLFECLTGRLPFRTSGWVSLDAEPTRLDTLVAGLPPALVDLLARALRRKPAGRIASAAALLEELAQLAV
jgi:CHASE2 domain-containing sensor protein